MAEDVSGFGERPLGEEPLGESPRMQPATIVFLSETLVSAAIVNEELR